MSVAIEALGRQSTRLRQANQQAVGAAVTLARAVPPGFADVATCEGDADGMFAAVVVIYGPDTPEIRAHAARLGALAACEDVPISP